MSQKNDKNVIPNNISPVRYILNEAHSEGIKFLHSYEEAKVTKDAVLIMEGDWGGQIYLVCSLEKVKCDKEILELLLTDLDSIAWGCNEGEGKGMYFEIRKIGEGISVGMGGGIVTSELWLHPEFKEKGYDTQIKNVIEGRIQTIRS